MISLKKTSAIMVLLAVACRLPAQYEAIFKIPFPQQYHVMDSIIDELGRKDSVIALSTLKQMEAVARQSNNELALLNFRRSMLNYYYNRSQSSNDTGTINKLIGNSKDLLAATDEKKYPELAAMLNMGLGFTYYYWVYRYNLAFTHYIKAYNLFKNVSTKKFPDRQYLQYAIARAYYQFNDFDNAIRLGKENESIYPVKNYISVFNVQMMGLSYLNLKMYDSALSCFQWVMDNNMISLNPVAWKGIAWGSIGNVYFFTNQHDRAIPYLDSGINYTVKTGVHDNAAEFAAHLSTIYLKKENMPLAKKNVETAYRISFQLKAPINKIYSYQWILNYFLVYQCLSDYYKKAGNTKFALIYLDSANFLKDSIAKWHDVTQKYQGELAVEKERIAQNKILFEEEESKNKLIRNGLIIFIILIMLITLLLYSRSTLKIKNREQQLLAGKQLAEAELKNAVIQLSEFTKSILEKNELIEKVTMEAERLGKEYQQLQDQQLKPLPSPVLNEQSLRLLQESVLLTDDDWKDFTKLFDKVHEGFFFRLKEKLPGLSPAETRFAALSKLKLSNKEMAAILGVSTDAIRQSRSRLKKKLNLAEDIGIEEAVEGI